MTETAKRVLIVEDDAWLGELFATVIEAHYYAVRRATSAESAIELIDDFTPDVLLLDMLLTGPNAMTLLHELQSYEDTKRLPVVLCTSLTHMHKNFEALKAYGVRSVLNKATLTPASLLAAIEEALS